MGHYLRTKGHWLYTNDTELIILCYYVNDAFTA